MKKGVCEAREFAEIKHAGQKRDVTGNPYIFHLISVYGLLKLRTKNEKILMAGILHDVIEDTDTTYDDLKIEFGVKVANLVRECTKPYEKLNSKEALMIKFADLLDNVSDHPKNDWIENKCNMIKDCKRCS